MVNGLRKIYPRGLKGFGSKICVDFWFRYVIPEEGQRKRQPKRCENKNENSPNNLNDKIY